MKIESISVLFHAGLILLFYSGYAISASSQPLGADLRANTGYAGEGYVRYREDKTGGSFEAAIQLPIDGAVLRDRHNASDATFTLIISNGAKTIANCTLGITEIGASSSSATAEVAEYQASVFEADALLTTHDGSCNGAGLPKPGAGDTINVILTGGNTDKPVLSGMFSAMNIRHR